MARLAYSRAGQSYRAYKRLKIALDYDLTYTLDPEFWDEFIFEAKERGHSVVVCTVRDPVLDVVEIKPPCYVIYTNGKPKIYFYKADVWIDDNPKVIHEGSKFTPQQLEEWRANGRK